MKGVLVKVFVFRQSACQKGDCQPHGTRKKVHNHASLKNMYCLERPLLISGRRTGMRQEDEHERTFQQ